MVSGAAPLSKDSEEEVKSLLKLDQMKQGGCSAVQSLEEINLGGCKIV